MRFIKNIVQRVVIFFLSVSFLSLAAALDPLSKISIKSNRATCLKSKGPGQEIVFKYLDDVLVEFADHSTVRSRELEVIGSLSAKKDTAPSHVKKITFTGNVIVSKDDFKATADTADVVVDQRLCFLKGNVHIQHTKKTPKDFPVDVKSEAATIKFDAQEIQLAGSSKNPVSTVINLENHPIIRNKQDKKDFKQHKKDTVKKA